MGAPFYYDYRNIAEGVYSPSTVHVHDTALARCFKRYLYQEAISVFKWEIPDNWALNYMLYTLYSRGYFAVTDTAEYGVIPQDCTLNGYNVFYQPKEVLITNPCIPGVERLEIGRDATLVKLQPDYCGIDDIVNLYGDMMALCVESAGVNLMNSHLAYVLIAKNKSAAQSLKEMFDRVSAGEPAVAIDPSLLNAAGEPNWLPFSQNLNQNYIADRILSDLRKWKAEFDTIIGVPNVNQNKAERLIIDEVNANNTETKTRCELWLESLQDGCRKAREMFPGLIMDVEWRNEPVDSGVMTSEHPED